MVFKFTLLEIKRENCDCKKKDECERRNTMVTKKKTKKASKKQIAHRKKFAKATKGCSGKSNKKTTEFQECVRRKIKKK